jgi:hypothetical protein
MSYRGEGSRKVLGVSRVRFMSSWTSVQLDIWILVSHGDCLTPGLIDGYVVRFDICAEVIADGCASVWDCV